MQRRAFLGSCLTSSLVYAGCQPESNEAPSPSASDGDSEGSSASLADADRSGQAQFVDPLNAPRTNSMYGLISLIKATEGNRQKLVDLLLGGTESMPGCKLYAISLDESDENGIWITEIWDSQESHSASLQLPGVQQAMSEGKPMIAGFGARHVVTPVGGTGVV